MSWKQNLLFRAPSGFWGDDQWYDLHMEYRLPLSKTMAEEMVYALPPLKKGLRVADVGAGSCRLLRRIIKHYPNAEYWAIDQSQERLEIGYQAITGEDNFDKTKFHSKVWQCNLDSFCPLDVVVDVMVLGCSLRHFADPPAHYTAQESDIKKNSSTNLTKREKVDMRYRSLLKSFIINNLCPGGHLFIGDHVAHDHPGVMETMKIMEDVGFVDVDVAWRKMDWFVIAGFKPV